MLLACPNALLRAVGETRVDPKMRVLARVLALRHLAQIWLTRSGNVRRLKLSARIDAIHAASALAFGVIDRQHRRVAFLDAAVAAAFATWTARDLRNNETDRRTSGNGRRTAGSISASATAYHDDSSAAKSDAHQ